MLATWMFEVYYLPPLDPMREARILSVVQGFGGWLDCREGEGGESRNICLTYEFGSAEQAESAAEHLPSLGEYVEGPSQYS